MKTHIRKISRFIGIKIGLFAMAYIPLTSLQAEAVLPTQEHVMAQMEKVANWQVARTQHMTHVGRARAGSEAYGRWIQGAFYKGLTKLAERSDNPFYENWIGYVGSAHDWKMGKVKYFADDHVIGQTNLWYYRRHKNEEALTPVTETIDWLIEKAPDNSLEFVAGRNKDNVHNCQWRWCWADALFMGPPVFFELSVITGEPKYADYAHKEFQATIDYLQDPKTKLLFRDSRYFNKKGKFGEQVFWSRGMGWVYAGVVHALESLPQDHQYRPYYESLYQELTSAIVKLQKQDGAWPMSLLAGERYVEPETSGTAFFTYGLIWGINNNLLNESTYLPSALKGWQVLSSAVHPDGKFGWVQGVNEKPDVVTKDDSQLFGVGAFLLAGSAMYDFVESQ